MVYIERIPTYIPGFDALIEGGLPEGSLTLLSGTPGSGKSIFCAQMLYNNAKNGKRCLYLDLEQEIGDIELQMRMFGWETRELENLRIFSIDSSNPQIVEKVIAEIEDRHYDLIVLDSLDSITTNPGSVEEIQQQFRERVPSISIPNLLDQATLARLKIKKIFSAIKKSKATALATSERVEGGVGVSRDTVSEFLCDGVVIFTSTAMGKKRARSIEISKMRHTNTPGGRYDLEIAGRGLVVL
ncbi:MAG TPA: AAA family ATPase [Candidatus Diapherotrites archaeon]|uniref:AAA family ATPase n=1 Tax=Candidatus Iainarchaeum sp. TaxID=3101447 RepID=A0A7J4IX74_9ARCH|nr:AAA family ATPase [Candidatus Diapherotrites archaeon]